MGRRLRRQDASTTTAYIVPTTCSEVFTLMDDIATTLADNPAGVTPLITALTAIRTPLDTPCTLDDVTSLGDKASAAKETANAAVAEQTNLKAAAAEAYNAANEELMAINEAIFNGGGTTIPAGTAAPTFATVYVEPTTGSTFSDGSTFTGSTGSFGTDFTGTGDFTGLTGDFTGSIGSTGDFTGSTGSTGDFTGSTGSTGTGSTGSIGTGSTGSTGTGSTGSTGTGSTGSTGTGSTSTGSTGSTGTGSTGSTGS